jgi:beta-xylosidase
MIAEGGTGLDHAIMIARSTNITGPYEAYTHKPILRNSGTNEYFQTVRHGDLFQDVQGKWWGRCLSTRSGPEWEIYPMGRETSLFPVTWNEGEWPIIEPVRGKMSRWQMPKENRTLHGDGPLNGDAESYDFNEGSAIPASFMYWHVPRAGTFNTTGRGLQIVPSRNNLTGIPLSATSPELTGQQGLAFVGRRQTDTTFTFSVDLAFSPQAANQEAAVTVFSTQLNHIDVGLVLLSSNTSSKPQLSLRFRTIGTITAPTPNIIPVPGTWANGPIRLQIQNTNGTHYNLVAMPASNTTAQINLGTASAAPRLRHL